MYVYIQMKFRLDLFMEAYNLNTDQTALFGVYIVLNLGYLRT